MTSYPLKYEYFLPKETAFLFFFFPFHSGRGPDASLHRKTVTPATATDEVSEGGLQFRLPLHTASFIMKSQRHMPEETG